MRRPAIVVMCVLLVATLVSPNVALAKGGNGRHSVAAPKASDNGKANGGGGHPSPATPKASGSGKDKAGKGKPGKSDAGSKPVKKTAKPTAASPRSTTAKAAPKVVREAPNAKAAGKHEPVSHEPPASAARSTKTTNGSLASAALAEEPPPSETIEATGIETRGVLDTIRVKVEASLDGLRATVAGMWSAVTSWLGD